MNLCVSLVSLQVPLRGKKIPDGSHPRPAFPDPSIDITASCRGDTIADSLNGGSALRNSFHDMEALLPNLFRPSLLLVVFFFFFPFLFFFSPFPLTSMHTHTHNVPSLTYTCTCTHSRTQTPAQLFLGSRQGTEEGKLLGFGVGRRPHPTPAHRT